MEIDTASYTRLRAPILALCLIAIQFCGAVALCAPDKIESSINTLVNKYDSVESRKQNPAGYVTDIDNVLKQTKFADILKCRDRINADSNIRFSTHFFEDSKEKSDVLLFVSNSIEHTLAGTIVANVTLNFNLSIGPSEILPIYLHELLHVCRTSDYVALKKELIHSDDALTASEKKIAENSLRSYWENLDPVSVRNIERYTRARSKAFLERILSEVEGNYVMQLAFEELSQQSVLLTDTLIGYGQRRRWLENGSFAQRIAYLYLREDTVALSELNDQKDSSGYSKFYEINDSKGFSMLHLNPEFKLAVQALGIKVID